MKSSPKLVIFGDPQKQGVGKAIEQFVGFAKDKADIVGNYSIEELGFTAVGHPIADCNNKAASVTEKVLSQCDYAVVFGG